jgi:hypothetical protein
MGHLVALVVASGLAAGAATHVDAQDALVSTDLQPALDAAGTHYNQVASTVDEPAETKTTGRSSRLAHP